DAPMERRLSAIAVYCGSSPGADPVFADGARQLGTLLAQRRVELVYGGGHVGLMGTVADAVLAGGGSVHGVITRALEAKEVAHTQLTSLQVVSTMHERKSAMADREAMVDRLSSWVPVVVDKWLDRAQR